MKWLIFFHLFCKHAFIVTWTCHLSILEARVPEDFNPQWLHRFRCLSKGQRLAYFPPCGMQRLLHQAAFEWKAHPEWLDLNSPPQRRGFVKDSFSQMAKFRISDKFNFRSATSSFCLVSSTSPQSFFLKNKPDWWSYKFFLLKQEFEMLHFKDV